MSNTPPSGPAPPPPPASYPPVSRTPFAHPVRVRAFSALLREVLAQERAVR